MQAAANPLDVLYVTDGKHSQELAGAERLRVSVASATDDEAWPATEPVDCLVVDAAGGRDPVETVRQVRQTDPSTPLVAFTGAQYDDIERVFEAGATDVVRSQPAETPAALIQRRVENVCQSSTAQWDQQELDLSNELLEQIGESLQDVIWINNFDNESGNEIAFVSAAYEEVWGQPCEHLLEHGLDEFYETIHPEDRAQLREVVQRARQGSGDYEVTYRIVRPDGEIRWIHDRTLTVYEDGEISHMVGIARDITERKERERQLERQNDLFTKAQDIANVGAWEYNLDGRNIWTEKIYDLFDVPQDKTLTLENAKQYYHPEDWPRVEAAIDRAVEEAEPFDLEVRMLTETDEQRWGRVRGNPQIEDGEVVRVRGTVQDITGHKKRERELERNRTFLKQIQEVGDVGGWEYDFRTGRLRLNEDACLLDLPSGSTPTFTELLERYHPEDRETVREAITQLRTEGESFANEVRVVTEDDETQWVYSQGEPVYENGEVVAMRGVSRDITERKEREHQLERQNDLFTKAQAIADVGAWERNLQTDEMWWTEQIYQIYSISSDYDPEPGDGMEYFHPEDRPVLQEAYERAIEEGESYDLELRVVDDNGTQKWVRARGVPQIEDGTVVRVRGTLQDITERTRREQRLQAERDLVERILETSPVGIHVYDADGHIVRANDQAATILGVEHDMLEGETVPPAEIAVKSTTGESLPESQTPIERVRRTGQPVRDETVIIETPAGDQVVVVVDAVPLFDDGELKRVVLAFDDVTERVERTQQLQAERDLISRILETSPVGLVVHDASGEIINANEQTAEILGIESDRLEEVGYNPDSIRVLSAEVDWDPQERLLVEHVRETGEAVHDREFVLETPKGERVVVVNAVPLFDDADLRRIIVTFENVTERVERERRLETQRDELARLDRINQIIRGVDTALVGATTRQEIEQVVCKQLSESGRYRSTLMFRASDDDLELRAVCQRGESELLSQGETDIPAEAPIPRAVEQGEIQSIQSLDDVDHEWTVCQAVADDDVHSLAAIPITHGDQTYGALIVCTGEDTFDERELDVLDELGETVGYAIGAVESREREATLTSLYEATQDLLAAETPQAVCDVVVETAASVLDPLGVGIFLFDGTENVLEMAAGTDTLREFYGDSTTFGLGHEDSITWQTYISGEDQFFTDIRESEHLANPDTDARAMLFLPLGEHGVFVVATSERTRFGEQKRRLIGLLGATTEAALDRVAGRAGIRRRDRRLAERATRLERLKRLFSLLGDVKDILYRAGTRTELEQGVCERLVDTDPYAFAWIGAAPPDGTTVEPRAWADGEAMEQRDDAYLDDVSLALDGDEPGARAATTGASVYIPNVTDHLRETDWAQPAVKQNYQSVLAVPLVYGDTTYGVLTIYATVPRAFDDSTRQTFERMGETIPRVINGLERDRAVLANQAVELELSLPKPETFLNAVAATVEEPVQYREVAPAPDGRTRVMFALTDPPIEDVRTLEEKFVTVESLDVVERADETVFRATLTGSTVARALLACGAIPHEIVAEPERTNATVRLPREVDVRVFLDRVGERYPDVKLASRRDVEVNTDAEAAANRALAEDLTDRQREVLRIAYESGFFESPRETTGVELADLLGVSQPTVTHHLREAQRRLFDALFEESKA